MNSSSCSWASDLALGVLHHEGSPTGSKRRIPTAILNRTEGSKGRARRGLYLMRSRCSSECRCWSDSSDQARTRVQVRSRPKPRCRHAMEPRAREKTHGRQRKMPMFENNTFTHSNKICGLVTAYIRMSPNGLVPPVNLPRLG